jgi:hypothetical protein
MGSRKKLCTSECLSARFRSAATSLRLPAAQRARVQEFVCRHGASPHNDCASLFQRLVPRRRERRKLDGRFAKLVEREKQQISLSD